MLVLAYIFGALVAVEAFVAICLGNIIWERKRGKK